MWEEGTIILYVILLRTKMSIIYCRIVSLCSLPHVVGTMCNVNMVIYIFVFEGGLSPHCAYGISSSMFWNFIAHMRNRLCLLLLWSCIPIVCRLIFLKHKRSSYLFYVTTKLVGFMHWVCNFISCTRITLFGNVVWMSCDALVMFLFVKLQLVGV
jgi:hypothetical protein